MKLALVLLLSLASLLAQTAPAPADSSDPIKQARKLNTEGKQDEALALYRKVLQSDPNSYEAHLGVGIALDLKGQYDEARREFAKAIAVAPPERKSQAVRNMAFSYAFERKPAEAARYEQPLYDDAIAKENFFAAGEVANELARIYLESGDLENALAWYQKGREAGLRQPNLTPAQKDLWTFRWLSAQGRIEARRGRCSEARQDVDSAKTIIERGANPEQAPFLPYFSGYVALYCGDTKTAIADLQKADQRDPFILVLLAQAYEESGDHTQAVELYRKVLTINSHNPTNAFARPVAKRKLS
ncbi:MAG: tetratricopeptide repeat protein [Terriglobales bacterium]